MYVREFQLRALKQIEKKTSVLVKKKNNLVGQGLRSRVIVRSQFVFSYCRCRAHCRMQYALSCREILFPLAVVIR